jgi:hypothetical protein
MPVSSFPLCCACRSVEDVATDSSLLEGLPSLALMDFLPTGAAPLTDMST